MKINIAIDGPSAAGKSTIAKILAERLGYVHLDTGAMYRCCALKARRNDIDLDDEAALCAMLDHTDIQLTPAGDVYLDGEKVNEEIRTDENSLAASKVSQFGGVRREMVKRQQKMAEDKGFIMDGRDIGTVVLPEAEVKVFMTASAHARAVRRYEQNKAKHLPTASVEEIAKEIAERDERDTTRSESPLRKAEDAIAIDTSDMTIEEVVNAVYERALPYVKEGEEE